MKDKGTAENVSKKQKNS